MFKKKPIINYRNNPCVMISRWRALARAASRPSGANGQGKRRTCRKADSPSSQENNRLSKTHAKVLKILLPIAFRRDESRAGTCRSRPKHLSPHYTKVTERTDPRYGKYNYAPSCPRQNWRVDRRTNKFVLNRTCYNSLKKKKAKAKKMIVIASKYQLAGSSPHSSVFLTSFSNYLLTSDRNLYEPHNVPRNIRDRTEEEREQENKIPAAHVFYLYRYIYIIHTPI